MKQLKTDICVIGAGSGGLSVAAGAVQMGARVVLVEGHKMGGDCLNYGCIPSKSLLASARHAHAMTTGGEFGITPVTPQIDYAAAKDHVARVVETIAPVDSQDRFEKLGCIVLRDWARFISPDEIQVGETRVRARRFVIATGSSPLVPPIDGLDGVPYHTNETIFSLRERPDHLLIVGGGPIGMEMAQAHRRLGCKVTVIEGSRALGHDDPEMAAIVLERLRDEGIEIVEHTEAEKISGHDGDITVETGKGTFHGSHLLIAVGRKVNIDRLDLLKGQVAHDRAVTVGEDLRSPTNRRVYAVGDCAGGLHFTHVANYHAGIVVRSAVLGLPFVRAKTHHLPWTTYTDPELAHVGMTEAQARDKFGGNFQIVRFEYDENDRAVAEGRVTGHIKVLVNRGKPVGATIAGSQAGELIAMWAMALANGQKMTAIANTVLPYPTLSEINKRAAGAYFSPRLFDTPAVKRVVGLVQRFLP
ncbi:dihydrolipoyl dehydrogenase family protein [Oceaniglobus indicus]|uniref:dihydrolipoyl dehydrogenase family protein n=1 Tax=Oceaniglobus indicus TaxID=2047749 RepID=UPI000C187E84|nr:FAD-dependent oxidoreductase [Oceaniglobus indicus]